MNFLVQMELKDSLATAPKEAVTFIEQIVFPTMEAGRALRAAGKIVAGGPVVGSVALALVVEGESAEAVDELVGSLPVWPRMKTTVTPLTTFEGRKAEAGRRLEELKARIK